MKMVRKQVHSIHRKQKASSMKLSNGGRGETQNKGRRGDEMAFRIVCSTDNASTSARVLRTFDSTLSTAFPAMVVGGGGTVSHQHASPRSAFEDIVYTLNSKSTAFLVVSGSDILGNPFGLGPTDVVPIIWMVGRGTKV